MNNRQMTFIANFFKEASHNYFNLTEWKKFIRPVQLINYLYRILL